MQDMSKIWCYQLTKTTQDDSRKSYKISNIKFSKEDSRVFQILSENPPKLSLIFLEIFQKDLFVLKYERYHLDLEIVEDICRHLYIHERW